MGAGQSDLYKGTYGDNIDNIPRKLIESSQKTTEITEADIRQKYINNIGTLSPDEIYHQLTEEGIDVNPLSKGKYKGISFEDGGGFKINFGNDGLFQYHPKGIHHNGGEAYYKLSTGYSGTTRYDLLGNILED